jgi:threonine dehydratase
MAKITSLGDACSNGVIAGSAGNHAQAVAFAARTLGLSCEVIMPVGATIAKMEAARALGATVKLEGTTVDEAVALARARAAEDGLAFIHPFDDPVIIAGQATLGMELLDQVPDLARVVVPVGGGGLISGVALAIKQARPEVEVVGVQVESCAPFPASLQAGVPMPVPTALTIADGIAIKRPAELTLGLIRDWVDGLILVSEDEISEAMVFLLERTKLVVEGAGAVGVAAVLSGRLAARPGGGTTVLVLSGGNVGVGLLSTVAVRHENQAGRRIVLLARMSDLPGSLSVLLSLVAAQGGNLVDVQHIREGVDLHIRETGVQLILETRGEDHARQIIQAVREAGYAELHLLN